MKNMKLHSGFTLAEVLITIGVIGVVAAMTIPSLMQGIGERSNSEKEANTAQKITRSMDLMRADGKLERTYESTDAFVDELAKYLKIVTRCDSAHLTNCWPTEKVTTGDGKEYEVSKAKKGNNLSIPGNKTDNVGIVLADGTSLILTYNENSEIIGDGDTVTATFKELPIGFGRTKKFAYSSSVTNPIAFVMDVNGFHGPNSETIDNKMHDIRSFNGAKFSKGCAGIEVDGIGCVTVLSGTYNWQGAMDACSNMGVSLPDKGTLQSIYNKGKADPSLGLPTSGNYWSSSEYSADYAYYVDFTNGYTYYDAKRYNLYALCLGN